MGLIMKGPSIPRVPPKQKSSFKKQAMKHFPEVIFAVVVTFPCLILVIGGFGRSRIFKAHTHTVNNFKQQRFHIC